MEKKEKKKEKQKQNKTSFPTDRGSFSSQRRLRYFALSLKLKDTRSAEFLAFVRPVVQWTGVRDLPEVGGTRQLGCWPSA